VSACAMAWKCGPSGCAGPAALTIGWQAHPATRMGTLVRVGGSDDPLAELYLFSTVNGTENGFGEVGWIRNGTAAFQTQRSATAKLQNNASVRMVAGRESRPRLQTDPSPNYLHRGKWGGASSDDVPVALTQSGAERRMRYGPELRMSWKETGALNQMQR
jgi:hypothetical protein